MDTHDGIALTVEQLELRDLVRRFSAERVAPLAAVIDREERFPSELWEPAGAIGLLGVRAPERYGGSELGLVESCLVAEELARACVSTSSVVMNAADMVVGRLVRTDNADVRDRYLADVAGGRQIGCLAMTEPDAGSDVFSMRTTATPVSGGWQLDGEKVFITMAPVADFALVYARIGDDDFGLFLVRTDADGFTLGRPLEKMGWRGSPTCGFQLDACFVPDDDVLSAGGGRRVLLDGLDSERVVMAAMSTGLAQAALDASVEHARTRVQFGRRIGDFQMVQSKLAGMWADIEACRALTYRAAAADASAPRSLRGLASAAKLRAAGCAMQSSTDAVQVLGGGGFLRDLPVERYMRDAKLMQIGGGTDEVQQMVLARTLLGDF